MPRGKTTSLTVEVYRQLKGEGLNRKQIASKLGLTDTAVSKFTARHKAELEGKGVDTSYSGKPTEMTPDTIDKLLQMNIHLQNQVERIVKDIKKASPKEATKLIEVLIKCLSESRQQQLALQNIKSVLSDQKTVFDFFAGVAEAINAEVPKDTRMKIFQKILSLRNAYVDTAEIQKVIKGE